MFSPYRLMNNNKYNNNNNNMLHGYGRAFGIYVIEFVEETCFVILC